MTYKACTLGQVSLGSGVYEDRHRNNVDYILSLHNENLLQNHYIECGINRYPNLFGTWEGKENSHGEHLHWGWETPGSAVRGQFLGHWLAAASREVAATGNATLRIKALNIVDELALCQKEHGGEWVFSIPELYMDHLAQGHPNGVPQYVLHKTLMGLLCAYRYLASDKALDIARHASQWIIRWARQFDADRWNAILDVETGGMLEVWADLYEITHDVKYREMLDLYWHHHLFDPLLAGEDVLTNRHANTTIPEAIGAARAYEVTGAQCWKDVVEAYWKCAVERRGFFATGGCNAGEIWCPPFEYAARRGDKNQELCTVFNMMRLADVLFRWTGRREFLDYYELNSINGLLAQTHARTGMPSYYLPLEGGARKLWGSRLHDFWCCHGTAVEAGAMHGEGIYYYDESAELPAVVVARFVNSKLTLPIANGELHIAMQEGSSMQGDALHNASSAGALHRPQSLTAYLKVENAGQASIILRLRMPSWCSGSPTISVDGVRRPAHAVNGFTELVIAPGRCEVTLVVPKELRAVAIPDAPETVAFLDGPVVLAGIADRETTLYGDLKRPTSMLASNNERQWGTWMHGYRSIHQPQSMVFKPLYEVDDEAYCVYFPTQPCAT
ncbi:beta-L-arabinofuranosidase domain-containing protein [Bifidobacterium aquikefiri]|uniref:beta-L-arabinofuranosidase domain-containing protein n=1 Tax=Bifidobacterium aquikefiri TaxID=1653207 RepID=UPI0039E8E1FA